MVMIMVIVIIFKFYNVGYCVVCVIYLINNYFLLLLLFIKYDNGYIV